MLFEYVVESFILLFTPSRKPFCQSQLSQLSSVWEKKNRLASSFLINSWATLISADTVPALINSSIFLCSSSWFIFLCPLIVEKFCKYFIKIKYKNHTNRIKTIFKSFVVNISIKLIWYIKIFFV